MKKSFIIIALSALSLLSTATPLVDHAPKLLTSPIYNWNYTSYEYGIGAGYLSIQWPANPPTLISAELPNDQAIKLTHNNTSRRKKQTQLLVPDVRIGLEKSWHFAKHWTATIDLAVMTPSATCGYLLTPRTRLFIGAHYSYFLNFFRSQETIIQSSLEPSSDKTTTIHSSKVIHHTVRTKNSFLGLAPRIGIDHFLSPSTMLRISLSCDGQKLYDVENRTNTGTLLWPQLSVGIKKFF